MNIPQEWTEQGGYGIVCREVKEHWLCIRPGGERWLKTIDGHFRGSAPTAELARQQLEREALEISSAWELPS